MNNTAILCTAMACATAFATMMAPPMRTPPDTGAAIEAWVMDNPDVMVASLSRHHERQQAIQAEIENQAMIDRIAAVEGRLFDAGHSLEMGNLSGDVTMVMFSDYSCPHCSTAHGIVKQVLEADPDLRVILREYPVLGPSSDLAARFAVAVGLDGGRGLALEVHDALFAVRGQITEAHLERIAASMDLDYDELRILMRSDRVTGLIEDNLDLARTLEIRGTPNFVFAGGAIAGAAPAESLLAAVAAERAAQ